MPKVCILFKDTKKEKFWLPDIVWIQVKKYIPKLKRGMHSRGRPQIENRVALGAILYVLFTGCSWDSLKNMKCGCGASVAYKRYRAWRKAGVFVKLSTLNIEYQEKGGVNWAWLKCILQMIEGRKADTYLKSEEEEHNLQDIKSIPAFLDSIPSNRLIDVLLQLHQIPELYQFYREEFDLWNLNKASQLSEMILSPQNIN